MYVDIILSMVNAYRYIFMQRQRDRERCLFVFLVISISCHGLCVYSFLCRYVCNVNVNVSVKLSKCNAMQCNVK